MKCRSPTGAQPFSPAGAGDDERAGASRAIAAAVRKLERVALICIAPPDTHHHSVYSITATRPAPARLEANDVPRPAGVNSPRVAALLLIANTDTSYQVASALAPLLATTKYCPEGIDDERSGLTLHEHASQRRQRPGCLIDGECIDVIVRCGEIETIHQIGSVP